jgi:lysophospholipase L1-like esterase
MGKITSAAVLTRQGALAREFNDWTVASDGWLMDYPLKNVVVFDLFDLLTGDGSSNLLRYPTDDGYDSHPSRIGNDKVAEALIPFINRAVRRAGLAD